MHIYFRPWLRHFLRLRNLANNRNLCLISYGGAIVSDLAQPEGSIHPSTLGATDTSYYHLPTQSGPDSQTALHQSHKSPNQTRLPSSSVISCGIPILSQWKQWISCKRWTNPVGYLKAPSPFRRSVIS